MKRVVKFGIIGIPLIASLCAIYAFMFPRAPDTQKTDDIIGIWTSDYSYDTGGIIVRVNGETSYFSNGKYIVPHMAGGKGTLTRETADIRDVHTERKSRVLLIAHTP